MVLQSLAGLPAFLVYFCTGLVAIVAYLFVYTRITPHNEFQLIRDNDPAAAIALGLSLLGFVAPLVSAIAHAANVLDCLIWAFVALIVQIIAFYLVKVPVPNLSARIAAGDMAPAIWLGLSSLAAGLLNAACMIYRSWSSGAPTRSSASAGRRLCHCRRKNRSSALAMSRCW